MKSAKTKMLSSNQKCSLVCDYIKEYKPNTFIETGTYLGNMIASVVKMDVPRIYSIELSQHYYDYSFRRLGLYHGVRIIYGDSSHWLSYLCTQSGAYMFWLDAHYSGGLTAKGHKDTPIMEELLIIKQCNLHGVILIDDARMFGTDPAYPTIQDVEQLNIGSITMQDDIIRIILQ